MYLLPLNNLATKRIIDGAEHCDIYELPTKKDLQLMTDGFLKFVETVVNKIKRPGVSKKPRVCLTKQRFSRFRYVLFAHYKIDLFFVTLAFVVIFLFLHITVTITLQMNTFTAIYK